MRILGIDFGEARMGLAVSDPSEFLAGGIGTFKVTGLRSATETAAKKALESEVGLIVVGLPKNMNGSEGERAERIRRFAGMLAEETGIKVELFDERRTTILAHGFLNETGTHGKKRKDTVDTLSAQIILQSYLDRRKNQQNQ